jgi:hypothetical protein
MLNYTNENGMISKTIPTKNGDTIEVVLANFSAEIVERITLFSTSGPPQVSYKIDYQYQGENVSRRIEVPHIDLESMAWVTKYTPRIGTIYGNVNAKHEVFSAIRESSGKTCKMIGVVPHIGWAWLDGKLAYLTPQGPIYPNLSAAQQAKYDKALKKDSVASVKYRKIEFQGSEIRVQLPEDLQGLDFARKRTARNEELAIALNRLVALGEVGVLCLAAPVTAVLGHGDFCVFLHGPSGTFKSTIASVPASFQGRGFNERRAMGTFNSSPNALAHLVGCMPDGCPVLDDFVQELSRELERAINLIVQGTGNNTGRQRSNGSGGLQATSQMRAIPIIAGEDRPERLSLLARVVYLHMRRGDVSLVDLQGVTESRDKGHYNMILSEFLQWVVNRKPNIDRMWSRLQSRARSTLVNHKGTPTNSEQFSRLINNYGSLLIGLSFFRKFLIEIGIKTRFEIQGAEKYIFNHLAAVFHKQVAEMTDVTQDVVILKLLRASLLSGDAYLTNREGEMPEADIRSNLGWKYERDGNHRAGRTHVGYISDDASTIHLLPVKAAQLLNRAARESNINMSFTPKSIGNVLRKHLLVEEARQSRKSRLSVSGKSVETYALSMDVVFEKHEGGDEDEDEDSDRNKLFHEMMKFFEVSHEIALRCPPDELMRLEPRVSIPPTTADGNIPYLQVCSLFTPPNLHEILGSKIHKTNRLVDLLSLRSPVTDVERGEAGGNLKLGDVILKCYDRNAKKVEIGTGEMSIVRDNPGLVFGFHANQSANDTIVMENRVFNINENMNSNRDSYWRNLNLQVLLDSPSPRDSSRELVVRLFDLNSAMAYKPSDDHRFLLPPVVPDKNFALTLNSDRVNSWEQDNYLAGAHYYSELNRCVPRNCLIERRVVLSTGLSFDSAIGGCSILVEDFAIQAHAEFPMVAYNVDNPLAHDANYLKYSRPGFLRVTIDFGVLLPAYARTSGHHWLFARHPIFYCVNENGLAQDIYGRRSLKDFLGL